MSMVLGGVIVLLIGLCIRYKHNYESAVERMKTQETVIANSYSKVLKFWGTLEAIVETDIDDVSRLELLKELLDTQRQDEEEDDDEIF